MRRAQRLCEHWVCSSRLASPLASTRSSICRSRLASPLAPRLAPRGHSRVDLAPRISRGAARRMTSEPTRHSRECENLAIENPRTFISEFVNMSTRRENLAILVMSGAALIMASLSKNKKKKHHFHHQQ